MASSDAVPPAVTSLGSVGRTGCLIVHTDEPWNLDIDALIVPVGEKYGSLGDAVRAALPDGIWSTPVLTEITPEKPRVLLLPPGPQRRLSAVVLATPHPLGGRSRATPDAVGIATATAITATTSYGWRALGLPLLGTGRVGMPARIAAAASVAAVRRALSGLANERSPETLAFIVRDATTAESIFQAWHDTGPLTSDTELSGGISGDLVDFERGIGLDQDHLGVAPYVTMLASMIAGKDTPVPLSIGLFGAWGSGKSYFMAMLRKQVDDLAADQDGYLSDVEQIGFNAWHYADTNLWASLGHKIFAHLASLGEPADARRIELRQQFVTEESRSAALQKQATEATDAAAEARRTLAEATERALDPSIEAVWSAVLGTDEVHTGLGAAARRLGVSDQAEQASLLRDEMQGLRQDMSALRRLADGPAALWLSLALAACAVAPVASDAVRRWFLSGGLAGLTTVLAVAVALVHRAREGVRRLADVVTAAQGRLQAAAAKQVVQEQKAVDDTKALSERLATALRAAEGRREELRQQLAELAPGQRLHGFLTERAQSGDYRDKLGLISMIRNDFEQLIERMREWHDEPGDTSQGLRPISRIVLYIDDLDRCSPRQVVDVLQAVHLLLALDLFVVVLGVDPRWLLHSLRRQYRDNFSDGADASGIDGETWTTTPLDYLEKIFNIPFVLPGMTARSFVNLISQLSGPVDDNAPPQPQPAIVEQNNIAVPPGPGRAPQPGSSTVTPGTAVPQITVEVGSAVDDIRRGRRARPLGLTVQERTMRGALGPLVETPRAAKRLLNLYRTLRSTRDLSSAAVFLGAPEGGEYQAVALLLGLLTAEPSLMGSLLWGPPVQAPNCPGGICLRPPSTPWPATFDGLTPQMLAGGTPAWHNSLGRLTDTERGAWLRVVERLKPASNLVTLPDLTAFQVWGPQIARFSFILSPFAAGVASADVQAR